MMMELNKEQAKAASTPDGNLLIVASAGTGKTTTIVERYANLVETFGYSPDEVLMTTFTNKAAKDMIQKISKRTARLPAWIGTMHSLFLRMLRKNAGLVMDSADFTLVTEDSEKKKIIKEIAKKEKIRPTYEEIDYLIRRISRFKSLGIRAEDLDPGQEEKINKSASKEEKLFEDEIVYISSEIEDKTIFFYKKYQGFMKDAHLLDFDDILLYSLELLEKHPQIREGYSKKFRAIMVDEAQDLNVAQIKILNLLSRDNLCLIGDDCQNIYEWRGSSNELVFQFEKKHKKVVLEDNYRSSENIIEAVNNSIKHMKFKIPKRLRCTRGKGEKVKIEGFMDFKEEKEHIAISVKRLLDKEDADDICVLVRTNYLGKDIEREFIKNRIPCHLSRSKGFLDREEVKDVLSFLKLLVNPDSSIDFERVMKIMPGVGQVSINRIIDHAFKNQMNYLEALEEIDRIKVSDSVKHSGRAVLDSIDYDRPIESFLKSANYLRILESKYCFEELKLEEKLENLDLLLEMSKGFKHDKSGVREFLDSLIEIDKTDKDEKKVKISTIHAAKGLEWKHVFLAGCNEKILPYYKENLTDLKKDAELRLFYVAISRAKDFLTITFSHRNGYRELEPSSFIDII